MLVLKAQAGDANPDELVSVSSNEKVEFEQLALTVSNVAPQGTSFTGWAMSPKWVIVIIKIDKSVVFFIVDTFSSD